MLVPTWKVVAVLAPAVTCIFTWPVPLVMIYDAVPAPVTDAEEPIVSVCVPILMLPWLKLNVPLITRSEPILSAADDPEATFTDRLLTVLPVAEKLSVPLVEPVVVTLMSELPVDDMVPVPDAAIEPVTERLLPLRTSVPFCRDSVPATVTLEPDPTVTLPLLPVLMVRLPTVALLPEKWRSEVRPAIDVTMILELLPVATEPEPATLPAIVSV